MKLDKTSRKAFEITKNVKMSNADTIADVRSGGLVGELKTEIAQLQAEIADRLEWNKACIESAAIASAEISKLQAENEKFQNEQDRLIKGIDTINNACVKKTRKLQAENAKYRKALELISGYADAKYISDLESGNLEMQEVILDLQKENDHLRKALGEKGEHGYTRV